MEIQRICEAAATPVKEGANLSEQSNNKRIVMKYQQSAYAGCFRLAGLTAGISFSGHGALCQWPEEHICIGGTPAGEMEQSGTGLVSGKITNQNVFF